MNQTYLAQVDKFRIRGGKLNLVAVERSPTSWAILNPIKTLPLPSQHNELHENELVLVLVDSKQQVIKIVPALRQILLLLQDWSLKLTKLQTQESENQLNRESVALQFAQLHTREEEVRRREERVSVREKKATEIMKLATANNKALTIERQALADAWAQVVAKQKELGID